MTTRRTTYTIAGQAVAVRVHVVGGNNNVLHLHNDHLGSNSVMSYHSNGSPVPGSRTRYLPFGDYRTAPTQTFTDRGYTGHLHNDELGLVYMNARFFMPSIGRFASADSIVPEPGNPQSLNRFSYVLNNPLRYVDPDGHTPWDVVDVISFLLSLNDFRQDPSLANAGWLALDTVSLIPILPSVGSLRHGARLANYLSDAVHASRAANRVADAFNVVQVGNRTFNTSVLLAQHFDRAAEFGINNYTVVKRAVGTGSGLQVHHIIEKRFVAQLGLDSGDILAVALTHDEHLMFTHRWREAIGYNNHMNAVIRTGNITSREQLWRIILERGIYDGYPELLEAAKRTLFDQSQWEWADEIAQEILQ